MQNLLEFCCSPARIITTVSNLVLHTLSQPLKIADNYLAKIFTTIFSYASFPNPGLLVHRG
jgi:hypothetical protein